MAELIWDGKYDQHGNKRAPVRIELPFQTVETVNESVQERQRTLELSSSGHDPEWRNRLIWGDKKYVLPSLLPEFAGKVDLIYIDPPFDTGANFSYMATVPERDEESNSEQTFTKEASILEQKAYRDTWGRGLESYAHWFYESALLLHELLGENGSLYVHCDWRVNSYIRGILDEVFGVVNFRNEIIWRRSTSHSDANRYGQVHDSLYWYSKGTQYPWEPQYRPYSQEYIDRYFRFTESDGRRYWKEDATGAGTGPARKFGGKIISPPAGRHWRGLKTKLTTIGSKTASCSQSQESRNSSGTWTSKKVSL